VWCTRKLHLRLRDNAALLAQAFAVSQTHDCAALETQCARLLSAHLAAAAAAAADDSDDSDAPVQPADGAAAGAAPAVAPGSALRAAALSLAALHAAHPDGLQTALAAALRDALHIIFGRPDEEV
jgi:hypothetical protein